MTAIHEMQQVIWVTNEKLGDGIILAIIDYGAMHNSVLMVGFESGEIKFLDTNQVKLTRNDTLGIGVGRPMVEPSVIQRQARRIQDMFDNSFFDGFWQQLKQQSEDRHKEILAAKNEIVEAFIAKHQLQPDEAELIIQDIDAVTKKFYVRKKQ